MEAAPSEQLLRTGALIRARCGVYACPGMTATQHDQLSELAIKNPNMVFCLLTALQIHGLTTQSHYLLARRGNSVCYKKDHEHS